MHDGARACTYTHTYTHTHTLHRACADKGAQKWEYHHGMHNGGRGICGHGRAGRAAGFRGSTSLQPRYGFGAHARGQCGAPVGYGPKDVWGKTLAGKAQLVTLSDITNLCMAAAALPQLFRVCANTVFDSARANQVSDRMTCLPVAVASHLLQQLLHQAASVPPLHIQQRVKSTTCASACMLHRLARCTERDVLN